MTESEQDPLHDDEKDLLVVLALSNRDMGSQGERDSLEAYAEQLEEAVLEAAVGEYDGSEYGGGEYILFFCGPAVQPLIDVLRPLLLASPLASGARFELMLDGPDGELVRQRLRI